MALYFGTSEILGLYVTVSKLGYAKQKPISVNKIISQRYTSRGTTRTMQRISMLMLFTTLFANNFVAGLITISTKSNTADILTKSLSSEADWRHMSSPLVNNCPENEGF